MKNVHNITEYRERLKRILLYFAPLPEEVMQELLSLFTIETFPSKALIFGPNTTDNKLYFVISGLVKIHYEAEGKEINYDFKEPNTLFLNGYAIYTKRPNFDYYSTMKPTVVLSAEYDKIEVLAAKYHSLEHLARKVVEAYYAIFLKLNLDRLFLSADERFDNFVRDQPSLMNIIPMKLIASHLGLTPETLSRLRARKILESK